MKGDVMKVIVNIWVNVGGTSFNGGSEDSPDSILLENGGILSTIDIAQEEGSELWLLGKNTADVFDHNFGFGGGFGHAEDRVLRDREFKFDIQSI
jgi:hypothetical protein